MHQYINLINLDFLTKGDGDTDEAHRINYTDKAICTFFYYMPQLMVGRYVNIMVFTEDLWFLSGMTTVLLQKT